MVGQSAPVRSRRRAQAFCAMKLQVQCRRAAAAVPWNSSRSHELWVDCPRDWGIYLIEQGSAGPRRGASPAVGTSLMSCCIRARNPCFAEQGVPPRSRQVAPFPKSAISLRNIPACLVLPLPVPQFAFESGDEEFHGGNADPDGKRGHQRDGGGHGE